MDDTIAEDQEPTLILEDTTWSEGQWQRFLEILFGSNDAPEPQVGK